MKLSRPSKLEVGICVCIVLTIGLVELWWHQTPLLIRIRPSSYYYGIIQLADEKIGKGDFRGAKELLETVIQKFPDTADAYEIMGDTLLKEGDRNGAVRSYEMALQRLGSGFTNVLSVAQHKAGRPRIEEKIRGARR